MRMRVKILIGLAILAIVTGCAKQPELDVNAEQNGTEQNQTAPTEENQTASVEQNQTAPAEENQTAPVEQNQTANIETNVTQQPTESDLTDTTAIKVNQNSVKAEEENKTKVATITLTKMDKEQKEDLASLLAKQVVHFDFDKYNIRPDQMPIVEKVANILKEHPGNWTVRIEGNCDEWGTDEYNYALGLKRAKTVKEALVALGVDADKLTIISYGESNPVCTAHARWCWAKNRRDNFTLLP